MNNCRLRPSSVQLRSVKVLAAAMTILSCSLASPVLASGGAPDSVSLNGAWRWIRSFGGLLGANETPTGRGFERVLFFKAGGRYDYVERDSSHEYLLCAGPVAINRYESESWPARDSLAWLVLDDWWVYHEHNMLVWFLNNDTLAAYPGSPSSGVDDALTHWFVRDGKSATLGAPESRLPRSDRPPRPPMDQLPMEGEFVYYESAPRPITQAPPQYPIFAREAGIEGTVILHLLVGKDGRVKRVRVARGVTGLNEAAAEAAKQWVFSPALCNNKPVAVWFESPVHFPP